MAEDEHPIGMAVDQARFAAQRVMAKFENVANTLYMHSNPAETAPHLRAAMTELQAFMGAYADVLDIWTGQTSQASEE